MAELKERADKDLMDKVVSLAKRRGFVYQSSEIYGGLSGAWDYGPMGIELKNNIQRFWWKEMTRRHDNIVGLDASILMHPKVWEASGHIANFSDPLVDCKKCKGRFRADHIDAIRAAGVGHVVITDDHIGIRNGSAAGGHLHAKGGGGRKGHGRGRIAVAQHGQHEQGDQDADWHGAAWWACSGNR